MKRIFCILFACILCFALFSCSGVDFEETIQGEGIKSTEEQSDSEVSLYFNNGTAKRTETTGSNTTELTGTYVVDSKGVVKVTYSDNSTQSFNSYLTDNGTVLSDVETGSYYSKKK